MLSDTQTQKKSLLLVTLQGRVLLYVQTWQVISQGPAEICHFCSLKDTFILMFYPSFVCITNGLHTKKKAKHVTHVKTIKVKVPVDFESMLFNSVQVNGHSPFVLLYTHIILKLVAYSFTYV